LKVFTNSAWPMLLVSVLAIGFFIGGVALEFEAGEHGVKKLLDTVSKVGVSQEVIKEAMNYQLERVGRLHQVAVAAIDLAKIGMGAVVALATQHITIAQRSA
jgi:hypothetical protein